MNWQMKAVAWLRGKAAEQAQNNERWPEHAKCYPSWTERVEQMQRLASELESEATVEAGHQTDEVKRLRDLLRRGLRQLEAWQEKYGEWQPQWLPPAGDVRWAEDVEDALKTPNPSITLDELVDALGRERVKLQWTINDCKKDELIEVVRDDVTGKPAYRLTDKGKAWLVNRPAIGEDTTKPAAEKPAQAAKTKPQAKNGKRYFYLFDSDGFDTPEEACEMVMHEVASEDMRNVSQGYKTAIKYNRQDSPWIAHFNEMAKKTAIRRLFKYLPVSIEIQQAVGLDEAGEEGFSQDNGYVIDGVASSVQQETIDAETGEITDQTTASNDAPAMTYAEVADQIEKAKTRDAFDVACDLIQYVADERQRDELAGIVKRRLAEFKAAE